MAKSRDLGPAVQAVTDRKSLLRNLLAEALEWPVPEKVEHHQELGYGWTEEDLRAQALDRELLEGQVWQLHLRSQQPWGIFVIEFARSHVYRTVLRQVLRGLVPSRRRDPNLKAWHHENLLFICATRDYDQVTFAHFRGEKAQTARLATFGWQKHDKHLRTLCEFNLPALMWPNDGGRDEAAWLKQWTKAFDKEPLTKDFFKRFDAVVEAVQQDLEKHQGLSSALAYSRAQLVLERLVFLYFLQNRGWLDQKRDYLLQQFQSHRGRPKDFSFYGEFLETLFWTLSSAPGEGGRLLGIPFLNGGLFDDDEFAPTPLRKKHNPPLKITNAAFAEVFDKLLEAFNFTVREDTPLDQDVAVDPEMLGKVFESIVLHAEAADPDAIAPDKRKATGSYYTPRIVVHFICREVLLQYLRRQFDWPDCDKRLRGLFELDAGQIITPETIARLKQLLTPKEGGALRDKLRDLKCCDPAVGSGAFPVGLLHELVLLRRIAETAANGYVDPVRQPGTAWLHEVKEQIVQDCLFGVDIQQQAIEICRLRLWLSLVVDYDIGLDPFTAERSQFLQAIDRISQLPNLEMNFHRGDSLLDLISGVPVRIEPGALGYRKSHVTAIQDLSRKLHTASRAERKKDLRVQILRKRLDLTEAVLNDTLTKLRNQDSELAASFFGESASASERRRRIAGETEKLKQAVTKLQLDRKALDKLVAQPMDPGFLPKLRRLEGADFDSPFNFAWQLDFAEVFSPDRGGFDIIVGNPPFVTARNPEKRELYRERWKRVCVGEYLLVSPFFDLSFGLLRPHGELGFIVSNAFAKREVGKALVEQFFPTVEIHKVVDCSGLSFPGHGTPTCLVFGQTAKPNPQTLIRVLGIVPGGGDLGSVPEDSSLWADIERFHDQPGALNARIVVADRGRSEMAKWPWNFDASAEPTKLKLEQRARQLKEAARSFGSMFDTHKDDAFMMAGDQARRLGIELGRFVPLLIGDQIRNWSHFDPSFVLKPYDADWRLSKEDRSLRVFKYLRLFKDELAGRATFSGDTYAEAGEPWYKYHQMSADKIVAPHTVVYPEIATHGHFLPQRTGIMFPQTAPLLWLKRDDEETTMLVSALLNSSASLLWLKQECFNKGAGKSEQRDRFEYAAEKMKRLPVPASIMAAALDERAKPDRLGGLARECTIRGRQFSSLTLRKVLERTGEAYHGWNSSTPSFARPHEIIGMPFEKASELRKALKSVIGKREQLRAEMIARQEEIDWLVYAAYGLVPDAGPSLPEAELALRREERAFCLWAAAGGDFDKAIGLIPAEWSAVRKALWKARLETIRDNEHVRRIEQPVYKRRWDEQWKVGNPWVCGQPAYDAEFLDAFHWWLSEKAEWWLEHKKRGGPIAVAAWAEQLWDDPRVKAAWEVAAEVETRLERWKAEQNEDDPAEVEATEPTFADFARRFKALVKQQSAPEDIPFAVAWEKIEKKRTVPGHVKRLRGKLNVPRERFWTTAEGEYKIPRFFE